MQSLKQYASAEELERYLGDPADPANLFSFARAIEMDERAEYPEQVCALLDEWGLHQYHIPQEFGGRLKSYEELLSLVRVIARRDPTVAYANLVTVWGTINIWIAGSHEQKQRVARAVNRNERFGGGITEKEHGNDLLASEVRAVKNPSGYLLSGEKWPLTHGTRCKALTVFARTEEAGGLRGFSMFLVEKDKLDESSYAHLPKLKTLGMRGADVSGIRFEGCQLKPDALIGEEGSGLELMLRFTQITRTMVPAISLGAADTALRATLSFALKRRLYGDTVFAIPHARKTLVDAFLDLLICECVSIAAVRSVHAATEQMSIWAAVNKYYVPVTVDKLIHNLSIVLGARYYLREGHWSGMFQKIVRDAAIVSVGHVPLASNLNAILLQLSQVANYRAKMNASRDESVKASLESIFSLEKAPPAFDPGRIALLNRGRDDVTQGLKLSLARVHGLHKEEDADAELLETISSLISCLLEEIKANDNLLAHITSVDDNASMKSPEGFELAKRHCALHAAAVCVHMWIHNRNTLGDFFAKGEWLALCLDRLLVSLQPKRAPMRQSYLENVAQELSRLHKEGRLFSIIPLQLMQSE